MDHQKRYKHRIALFGLGGVGKSQTAIEYCYRYKAKYKSIFWINSINRSRLLSGFASIVERTQCEFNHTDPSPENIARAALRWLRTHEDWLLVIDNLDDIAVVKDHLPMTDSPGHTLIITRNTDPEQILAEGIEVMTLSLSESVSLLLKRSKLTDDRRPEVKAEAAEIVDELGYLPLAIEQAGAFISNSRSMIFKYLKIFRVNRKALLVRKPRGNNTYENSVATTSNVSIERLKTLDPGAIGLLHVLAFLNPDEVPTEFLKEGCHVLGDDLKDVISDDLSLQESLENLQLFSLIRLSEDGVKISIHRSVQSAVQNDLDVETRRSLVARIVRMGAATFPDWAEGKNRNKCRKYRTQVISCLIHHGIVDGKWTLTSKEQSEWFNLLDRVATYLLEDGYIFDAQQLRQSQVILSETFYGNEHPDTLKSMFGLAFVYFKSGQSEEALQLIEQTLIVRRRALGEYHQDTLLSMGALASAYSASERKEEAAELHREILEIRKKMFGDESLDTLRSMTDLAMTYGALGKFSDGIHIGEEALEIRKRVFGFEHADTHWNMWVLATLYIDAGRTHYAADQWEALLRVQERMFGYDDIDTVATMGQLGWTYHLLGKNADAVRLLEDATGFWARYRGRQSIEAQLCGRGPAAAYIELGHIQKAVELSESTVAVLEQALGTDHPDTMVAACIKAVALLYLGRADQAGTILEETLERQQRLLGWDHPATLTTKTNVAMAYVELGKASEAQQLLDQTLKAQITLYGPENVNTLWTKHVIGLAYERLGEFDAALTAFEETLKSRKQILGMEHTDTLRSLYGLASAYYGLGRYGTAAKLFGETLKAREKVLEIDHPDIICTINKLKQSQRMLQQTFESLIN